MSGKSINPKITKAVVSTSKGKKPLSIEERFQKKTPREHVLIRPDMYIGSISPETSDMWIHDPELELNVKKSITYVPGFYKIIDELIVNARDHQVRDPLCTWIKMYFDQENGSITIWNNGNGIPIEMHKDENMWVPELIFGNLLTGENYDDDDDKVVGGRNGIGSKACNIYSDKFILETVDANQKKKYVQEWTNNMADKSEPIITNIKKGEEPYTKITCYPDFGRFGMTNGIDDDHIGLLRKRAYDISACTSDVVKVYLNDELIKVKKFQDYIKMHYKEEPELFYDTCGDRWKVGVVYERDAGKQQVSFVNGIWTYQGGTHVDHVEDQIYKKLIEIVKKKHKVTVKAAQFREHLSFFVDAVIVNPAFTSQTKGELKTKASQFGSVCTILPGFIAKIEKCGVIDVVVEYAKFKEESALKSNDGNKRSSVRGIPKLDDADWAGTRKSKECRLILTEGDSAKAFAIAGLKKVGRERFGVFPLKGKPLNFRKAAFSQIKKNEEFGYLKKILGLRQDKTYLDVKDLRYGGIIILTDQDEDGSHIKGLLINLFQCYWPELLKIDGFIQTMSTPLIKAFKKTDTKKKNGISFYNVTEYEKWANELEGNVSKWNIKYYKGLGTSDDKEAREIFSDFEKRIVSFIWETAHENLEVVTASKTKKGGSNSNTNSENSESGDGDGPITVVAEVEEDSEKSKTERAVNKKEKTKRINRSLLDPEIFNSPSFNAVTLAFDDGREDDRKGWLKHFDKNLVLEYDDQNVTYSDFFNKEFIHFSHEDNIRSIPSLIDGLKPSQRKILFACFKKNQTSEIKVAQLSAYVSEHTAYKHGEMSLNEAIIGMAQIYPGSNNICLLHPSGNHGHRNLGGKDHASPRYIFTNIEPLTFNIFRKEDESILDFITDEGEVVEPKCYYPVTCMALINGSVGVGTGYSSTIPQYNPKDVNNNLFRRMDGKPMLDMIPWFNGFNGLIEKTSKENAFKISGTYELIDGDNNSMRITEIPIKRKQICWIQDYKEFLDTLVSEDKKDGKLLYDAKRVGGNDDVNFKIEFKPNEFQKIYKKGHDEIMKFFKLTTVMTVSNLHMYNEDNMIVKYEDPLQIMEDFFEIRLKMYEVRRQIHLKVLSNELEILKYKVKFIEDYRSHKIIIQDQSEDSVNQQLIELEFPILSTKYNAPEEDKSYSYLTNIRLWSLSKERIAELTKEYNSKSKEFDDYSTTTALGLWRRELIEFDKAYDKWAIDVKDYLNDDDDDEKKPKKKSKTATQSDQQIEKKPKKKVVTAKK
jgi:DNA topoisomerase-2